ncbi:ash family protein [Paraburkholderia saeva]|uniref:ash family protein n=1 Tax=Paraburkholderia saeva TaxID=2777537 RepID=UPI001DEDF9E4|nr:ash family protein [Paraburkholderia saeva]CAG4908331.1 hypothetical protein R52603_03617 [Paraburkholderia saeva]
MLKFADTCKPVAIRYTQDVAETTAAGFGDLTNRSAQPRRAAFLCVSPSCASFNGRALAGRPSGLPVPSVAGSPTPPRARSPHLAMGRGLTANRRGRTMRHIHSHPEQTRSPIEIIRGALRDAAFAPTLSDALDIAGAALSDVARLACDDRPAARASTTDETLDLAHRVANETLRVFDRISCIFEAIQRLTCDSDDAVSDLANIGRSLAAEKCDRIDTVFTYMAHRAAAAEACHG